MSYIKGKETITTEHRLEFDHERWDQPGYSFSCDESGNVGVLSELAQVSYQKCVESGEYTCQFKTYTRYYREPDKIECECGAWVTLDSSWANGCPRCQLEYSGSGQRLAPRRFWGEETGETF